jgi:hypothetical protein
MNITNKTRRPISVPLPEGKKLFLGPGKTGQVTPKSAAYPPLRALVDAGDLELDDARSPTAMGSASGATAKANNPVRGATTNIRRTGDR